jgi:hypothetical protein
MHLRLRYAYPLIRYSSVGRIPSAIQSPALHPFGVQPGSGASDGSVSRLLHHQPFAFFQDVLYDAHPPPEMQSPGRRPPARVGRLFLRSIVINPVTLCYVVLPVGANRLLSPVITPGSALSPPPVGLQRIEKVTNYCKAQEDVEGFGTT